MGRWSWSTALRRGQEAGGAEVPGKSEEKRSKSAGKIGAGADATRGRTDGREPRPERIDWRDHPAPRCICVARRCCTLRSAVAVEIRGSWARPGQPRAAMPCRCEMSRVYINLQQELASVSELGSKTTVTSSESIIGVYIWAGPDLKWVWGLQLSFYSLCFRSWLVSCLIFLNDCLVVPKLQKLFKIDF
jgi:hypothetical protein